MTTLLRSKALSDFVCLGDKCEDTCCQAWSMQVDEGTIKRYQSDAPELLAVVEASKETPWIMRKDPATGFCVKLEGGLCGLYKQYGESFLGDACHFYPRMTRKLGSQVIMDATLSCPEVVRKALYQDRPAVREEIDIERLPHQMRDYLPPNMTVLDAVAIHQAFVAAAEDTTYSLEETFARIASVTRSIERVDRSTWPRAVPFYFQNVGMWLPMIEPNPLDPFNLLHALCGLIVATQKPRSARLRQTLDDMEQALAVKLDWQQAMIETTEGSLKGLEAIRNAWKEGGAEQHDAILRRYLQMQLADALFPFAGLGKTPGECITIIGVRLATIKLALMCSCAIYGNNLPQEVVVRVIQSISRILDHLADSVFSLSIYTETGWVKEGRMRGLLEM